MVNIVKVFIWRPLYSLYSNLKNEYTWKFVIPPYSEKRKIIDGYRIKFGLSVFIETGTFLGDTVDSVKNDFEKVFSIELSSELAERAGKRFEMFSHIKILQGDSGEMLGEIIAKIDAPILFWLDGHHSSDCFVKGEFIQTAKGELFTPILKELKSILSHKTKGHVILIDDARLFNGNGDYPKFREIKDFIHKTKPTASITSNRDIIRIVL